MDAGVLEVNRGANVPEPLTLERRLLRMSEAATVLGVSRSQLYTLVRNGSVPAVRIGNCLRVPVSAIDRMIEEALAPSRSSGE